MFTDINRKGTVHSSAKGHGGYVYRWGLPLRAQLSIVIYRKQPGEGQGWGSCTDAQGSCFQLITGGNSWALSGYPQWLHRTPLSALSGLFPLYIAIIVGPSAAALSGAQNSDFPQRKSALNRYWTLITFKLTSRVDSEYRNR